MREDRRRAFKRAVTRANRIARGEDPESYGAMGSISHTLKLDGEGRVDPDAHRAMRKVSFYKLLTHSVLTKLRIPTIPVLYGAFAHTSLGHWPQYRRESMFEALRRCARPQQAHCSPSLLAPARRHRCSAPLRHELGARRAFVLKPASDGTNFGLLVMTPDRCAPSRKHTRAA